MSESTIRADLKSLEQKDELISMKDLLEKTKKHKDDYSEFNAILKSFDPIFDQKTQKFIEDAKKPPDLKRRIRATVYILKSGDNQKALKFLLDEIQNIKASKITAIQEVPEGEIVAEGEVEIDRISRWRLDLETFDNQILKSDSFTILDLYKDIKEYFNACYLRRCPNATCRKLILTPNPDLKTMIKKPILNEEEADRLRFGQELYYTSYEDAKTNKQHPFSLESDKSKQNFKKTLRSLKEKYFTCPHCKKTLIMKQRLDYIDHVLFSVLVGVDSGRQPLFVGYPVAVKLLSCGT